MLIDWINDVLVGERIIVKDLAEDLYDGQVLQKLFGRRGRLGADSRLLAEALGPGHSDSPEGGWSW